VILHIQKLGAVMSNGYENNCVPWLPTCCCWRQSDV